MQPNSLLNEYTWTYAFLVRKRTHSPMHFRQHETIASKHFVNLFSPGPCSNLAYIKLNNNKFNTFMYSNIKRINITIARINEPNAKDPA